jgi:hypothetical protein
MIPPFMQINLNLDDVYDITVRGNQVIEQVHQAGAEGLSVQSIRGFIRPSERPVVARVSGSWKSRVDILEQPNRGNNYTIRLRVYEKSSGRNNVSIELAYE